MCCCCCSMHGSFVFVLVKTLHTYSMGAFIVVYTPLTKVTWSSILSQAGTIFSSFVSRSSTLHSESSNLSIFFKIDSSASSIFFILYYKNEINFQVFGHRKMEYVWNGEHTDTLILDPSSSTKSRFKKHDLFIYHLHDGWKFVVKNIVCWVS